MNSGEYLKIGQHAYTHGEVSASAALREQVRPTFCIQNETLQEGCFIPPNSLNAIWHFYLEGSGNQEVTKVEITDLPLRRFSRIAVLMDALPGIQNISMRLLGDPPFPWPFGADMTQINYSGDGVASPMFTRVANVRQTYQENFFPFVMVADGASVYNSENIPAGDMVLPMDDTHPMRVQITIPQMTP
jgi:hypothetical protein